MTRTHNPFREIFAMLPRLAAILLLVAAPVLAVGSVKAADPFSSGFLEGLALDKPSGVGFVLAVTIQRNQ